MICGSLHLLPFEHQANQICLATGDVNYCGIIYSRDECSWCIFKLRVPPLFLPPSFPPVIFYSLFRFVSPAFFVHASEFKIPAGGLGSWKSELIQPWQIKWIIIVFFCSILHCLFSLYRFISFISSNYPSYFSHLCLSSPLFLSVIISPVTHFPSSPLLLCGCCHVWVQISKQTHTNRWPSLTHIRPTDLTSDKD